MDKKTAYSLLTKELNKLSAFSPKALKEKLSSPKEILLSGEDGKEYVAGFEINENFLVGKIHDRNSFKFEILEERVKINGI